MDVHFVDPRPNSLKKNKESAKAINFLLSTFLVESIDRMIIEAKNENTN